MSRKYEFVIGDTMIVGTRILHRIRALKDFGNVRTGELGGYIESEENLSHDGNCWIYNNAWVADNAIVCDNATVDNYAQVYENARVTGNTCIFDYATICGNAIISGKAHVGENATVCGNSRVADVEVFYYVCDDEIFN